MSAATIDLENVSKTYRGKVHALRGLAMEVHPGEVFGLLGPNGAGKSTLVKIMMSVVRPTTASGTLLGHRLGHKPTLARVGYLPEHHVLPRHLTGRQVLDYFGALARVDRRTRRSRGAELLELVGMTDWADRKVIAYSKGMQQRVGLAMAMINDPELLILDEPTDGVDPEGRREIRRVIRHLHEQGKTVFINSHLLSELELVCHRVAILVQGGVVRQGTIDELSSDSSRYEIVVCGPAPAWIGEHHATATPLDERRQQLILRGATIDDVQPVIDRLRHDGLQIESVQPTRDNLEEIFLRTVSSSDGRGQVGAAAHPTSPRG